MFTALLKLIDSKVKVVLLRIKMILLSWEIQITFIKIQIIFVMLQLKFMFEENISSAREHGLISIITRSEIWEVSQWVFSSARSRYTRPRAYLYFYDAYKMYTYINIIYTFRCIWHHSVVINCAKISMFFSDTH